MIDMSQTDESLLEAYLIFTSVLHRPLTRYFASLSALYL